MNYDQMRKLIVAKQQKSANNRPKYGLKKLGFGMVSCLVGFWCFLGTGNIQASAEEAMISRTVVSDDKAVSSEGKVEDVLTEVKEAENETRMEESNIGIDTMETASSVLNEKADTPSDTENLKESLSTQETIEKSPTQVEDITDHRADIQENNISLDKSSIEDSTSVYIEKENTPFLEDNNKKDSIKPIELEKKLEEKSPTNALEALSVYSEESEVSSINEKELIDDILLNFETQADKVSLKDIVFKKEYLSTEDTFDYLIPAMNEIRNNNGLSANSPLSSEQVKEAQQLALKRANSKLLEDTTLISIAVQGKNLIETLLDKGLLKTEENLSVRQLETDLPSLYRGVLYLTQQFSFEEGLPEKLVFAPQTINNGNIEGTTAYSRLKSYGSGVTRKEDLSLASNIEQFNKRFIGKYTGTSSPMELVEVLSRSHQLSPEEYFELQTEAIIGNSSQEGSFNTLKKYAPSYILPLLSQGKGVYAAISSNSLTIGPLSTYAKEYTDIKTHVRGEKQADPTFFDNLLSYQDNWWSFINSVKKVDTVVPFTIGIDSMIVYDDEGGKYWSPKEGKSAEPSVVSFFYPMGLWESYKLSQNFGGMAQGENQIRAYNIPFMSRDLSGLEVYTHEMTHTNDEERLFGGKYQNNGRRLGQGPELYARGIFEVINNTQDKSAYKPVFSLNTAISIPESDARIQNKEALTSKKAVETYMRNSLDLISYLEAVEAEVVFETLTPEEIAIYFNQVNQITPKKLGSNQIYIEDHDRQLVNSTNESYRPFTLLDNAIGTLKNIDDLVDYNTVSGQFIPRGRSPFINQLTTNQYDSVPLLDSYYAGSVVEKGKNTIGDISFKRRAFELLGWKGWDAFISYLSNEYLSDRSVYQNVLGTEDYASFKKAQYHRVRDLVPKDMMWDEDILKTDLARAIKEDLNHIQELKSETKDLWSGTYIDDVALAEKASNQNFDQIATSVRNVKEDIYKRALKATEFMTPVLIEKENTIIDTTLTVETEKPSTEEQVKTLREQFNVFQGLMQANPDRSYYDSQAIVLYTGDEAKAYDATVDSYRELYKTVNVDLQLMEQANRKLQNAPKHLSAITEAIEELIQKQDALKEVIAGLQAEGKDIYKQQEVLKKEPETKRYTPETVTYSDGSTEDVKVSITLTVETEKPSTEEQVKAEQSTIIRKQELSVKPIDLDSHKEIRKRDNQLPLAGDTDSSSLVYVGIMTLAGLCTLVLKRNERIK